MENTYFSGAIPGSAFDILLSACKAISTTFSSPSFTPLAPVLAPFKILTNSPIWDLNIVGHFLLAKSNQTKADLDWVWDSEDTPLLLLLLELDWSLFNKVGIEDLLNINKGEEEWMNEIKVSIIVGEIDSNLFKQSFYKPDTNISNSINRSNGIESWKSEEESKNVHKISIKFSNQFERPLKLLIIYIIVFH